MENKKNKKIKEIIKEIRDYSCLYCGNKFKAKAKRINGPDKHNSISNQIKCTKCGNFLKTWE